MCPLLGVFTFCQYIVTMRCNTIKTALEEGDEMVELFLDDFRFGNHDADFAFQTTAIKRQSALAGKYEQLIFWIEVADKSIGLGVTTFNPTSLQWYIGNTREMLFQHPIFETIDRHMILQCDVSCGAVIILTSDIALVC